MTMYPGPCNTVIKAKLSLEIYNHMRPEPKRLHTQEEHANSNWDSNP